MYNIFIKKHAFRVNFIERGLRRLSFWNLINIKIFTNYQVNKWVNEYHRFYNLF